MTRKEEKNKRFGARAWVLLGLSLAYLLGVLFVFSPCGPKEDGTWMNCHWAGVAIAWLAGGMTALCVLRLVLRGARARMACSLALLPLAVAAFMVPGRIVPMCMSLDMRCHAVMAPAAAVFSALVALAALADGFLLFVREK